ncbi:(S)-ureidoglycine aminohydrolase [Sporosarcina koreensis]|uniref:(S)-ureidoglycine aminohydrolase n=1 Tax=Sporosarcina koreensis TaxID=334735 RepID=A0ABW0TYK7_9BACL
MGYPKDILSSRSIIKPGQYALIAPEGLVNNIIPGFENCRISILASPKLGADFVDYMVTMHEGGKNSEGYCGEEDVQSFVYVISGKVKAKADDQEFILEESGYLYCPPGVTMYLENMEAGDSRLFLYKRKHIPLKDGRKPWVVSGHANDIEYMDYDDMHNVHLKDLLPMDLEFDMNFHILSFDPAASHPFVETHYQGHGAYLLSGEGMYNLDNEWIPVKKGDYIFMAPYVHQAAYAVGREPLTYVYSKDCNRDASL